MEIVHKKAETPRYAWRRRGVPAWWLWVRYVVFLHPCLLEAVTGEVILTTTMKGVPLRG